MWATTGVRLNDAAAVGAVLDRLGVSDERARVGPFVSEHPDLNGRIGRSDDL
jgi:hypothetical protein